MEVLPGQETLIASWRALAQLSSGARVIRRPRSVAAVFPSWAPLNNAILLGPAEAEGLRAAGTELRVVYRNAGIESWALWLSSRATTLDAPDQVGEVPDFTRDTTTLVMRLPSLEGFGEHANVIRTSVDGASRAGDEPVPVAELGGDDGVAGLHGWALVRDGVAVSGAWSCIHGRDCGIYAVGTVPQWRRRGLARALVEHVLADARSRGARTASLQSTRMARTLYESLRFAAVGRYEEWLSP
jgi:GNAT superfamily N-acetyltransferase